MKMLTLMFDFQVRRRSMYWDFQIRKFRKIHPEINDFGELRAAKAVKAAAWPCLKPPFPEAAAKAERADRHLGKIRTTLKAFKKRPLTLNAKNSAPSLYDLLFDVAFAELGPY